MQIDHGKLQMLLAMTGKEWAAAVEWHPTLGTTQCATAIGDSREDAIEKAWKSAASVGYVPPKGWQYWRWGEYRRPA